MLKFLGTIETSLDHAQWLSLLARQGWDARLQDDRLAAGKGRANIEVEGLGLALVYGWLGELSGDLREIQNLLKQAGHLQQLDIFEEDGRMIKRVTG